MSRQTEGAALVARAKGLGARLRAEQDDADRAGHYSASLHEAFGDAGFYRILRPARFGGSELGFDTFYRVALEIATGHPGAGWCFALSASHLWIVASHFPADVQEEVLGDNADFIAPFSGSFNGVCATVEGGYEIDGTFGYASGAPYSTHLLGVAPVRGSDPPDVRLVLVPRSSYELVDDWGGEHTLGLRASGSHSVAVSKAFVPASHTIPFHGFLSEPAVHARATPGTELHGNPMYLGPLAVPFHLNLLAVVVGAARAAIDEFTAMAQTKRETLPPFALRRDTAVAQHITGEAMAKTATAEAAMFAVVAEFDRCCDEAVTACKPFTVADNLRLWAIGQQAAELAAGAVRLLFANSGTGASRPHSPMARYLADVSMYSTHPVANETRVFPMLGRAQLGLPAAFFGLDD